MLRRLAILVVLASSGCRTAPPEDIVTEAPPAEPDPVVEVVEPAPPEPEPTPEPATEAEPFPEVAVEGSLDRDIIRRVVRSHVHEIRECYNAGLTADPELRGRVTIDFIIGGDGKVTSSVVYESTLKDTAVPKCIVEAATTWLFPKPAGGGNVTVRYPFNLVPPEPAGIGVPQ
jgi:hypothetical protein